MHARHPYTLYLHAVSTRCTYTLYRHAVSTRCIDTPSRPTPYTLCEPAGVLPRNPTRRPGICWPAILARNTTRVYTFVDAGPQSWPAILARYPGPQSWPAILARNPGPESWPAILARNTTRVYTLVDAGPESLHTVPTHRAATQACWRGHDERTLYRLARRRYADFLADRERRAVALQRFVRR
jgi:hypothetical protein